MSARFFLRIIYYRPIPTIDTSFALKLAISLILVHIPCVSILWDLDFWLGSWIFMCANIIGSCQHFLLLCRFKYFGLFFKMFSLSKQCWKNYHNKIIVLYYSQCISVPKTHRNGCIPHKRALVCEMYKHIPSFQLLYISRTV